MRYVYSVIRYVPNPATGEFINIGAIAGSDVAGDWSIRQADNPRRARLFGPAETLTAVFAFMNNVGRRIDKYVTMDWLPGSPEEISESWLVALQKNYRNVVQLSPVTPVAASSAEEALAFVFEHLVNGGATDAIGRREYATRRQIFAELRNSYKAASIGPDLIRERAVLDTETSTAQLDFVVGNGSAVQLAHTWSFEIQSLFDVVSSVKSWGYTIKTLREAGGRIAGDYPASVRRDVPIEVVYAPPLTSIQNDAFEEARKVWRDVGAEWKPREDVRGVAESARKVLVEAGMIDATNKLDLFLR